MTATIAQQRAERVPQAPARWSRERIQIVAALAAAAGGILGANLAGEWLQRRGIRLWTMLPPLTASLDPRLSWRVIVPIGVAVAALVAARRVVNAARWRTLLVLAPAAACGWGVALAFTDGAQGFLHGPSSQEDAFASVPLISDLGSLWRTFVSGIEAYSTHARSHPPGLLAILWLLGRAGLDGPGWVAALEIGCGAAAVPAVLIAAREIAGERAARTAATFLTFVPAAVFWSSGDAIFLAVGSWAVAALVIATGREGRSRDVYAVVGGVACGAALLLSYGLALLACVPIAVAARRHTWRVLLVAGGATGAVLAASWAFGFSWLAGLTIARREYAESVAEERPYAYYVFANLAALTIALGPAVAAALARLRDRRLWLLVGGGLAAIVLADLSGLSKAEVERIWLPFMPWIALATATFDDQEAGAWLGANLAWALAVQLLVRSEW